MSEESHDAYYADEIDAAAKCEGCRGVIMYDECFSCGLVHGDPCPDCKRRALHDADCPTMTPPKETAPERLTPHCVGPRCEDERAAPMNATTTRERMRLCDECAEGYDDAFGSVVS
jgi:hypothetical protein